MTDLKRVGDGYKLIRDFPQQFQDAGITSLLELSYLARRVDPIGTGPGGTLISLAKLCKAYLELELDKDPDVRASNWKAALKPKQIECKCIYSRNPPDNRPDAANDVFAGLQIYDSLVRRWNIAAGPLSLNDFSSTAMSPAHQAALMSGSVQSQDAGPGVVIGPNDVRQVRRTAF